MERILSSSPDRTDLGDPYGSPDAAALPTRINRLLGALSALTVMLAIKLHFSTAAAGQLIWILAPTARLMAWLTQARPVWEPGVGYTDFARGIIIAPACAGINFMIMAFGLAAVCGLVRIRRLAPLLIWLTLALAAAYALALVVNALRIALSMWLYQADIYTAWITPERVHRLAGVGIYLSALGLFFKGLQPIINRYCRRFDGRDGQVETLWPAWLPMGWYLLGAVGVPTANLLFRRPAAGYGEHCLTVVLAGLALWACGRLAKLLNRRI
jgi:exosortase K